ncbi:MAG: helix-turn-helix domain-containing protein [Bacteroidales bacterium]|nr:helix-turn-helix domain-containing protein [Bacteroidales bacterium]
MKTSTGQEQYQIPYNTSDIFIDGDLSDWNHFLSIFFSDTLAQLCPVPDRALKAFYDDKVDYTKTWHPLSKNDIEIWICWNVNFLFLAFKVEDEHLFSEVKPAEDRFPIQLNDGIELYIDAKNDSYRKMDFNDYQFLVDVSGNSVVYRGDKQRFNIDTVQVPKLAGQNIYYETAVRYLNNTVGFETGYLVELAIPFAAIGMRPETGLKMKIDLCNNDIDYSLEGAQTYADTALRYWAFNMSGYSDFGFPETWKTMQLAGAPGYIERLSAAKISRYFKIYISVLVISILVISFLLIRMRKLHKLPAREDLHPQSILFLEKPGTAQYAVSDDQKILQQATDFISRNSHETINSEMLAKHLGVSLRKLQRITREELSCTPTNFIYILKLNLAAEFLRQGKANVSQTAYEFGFSDPGYFTRLFHKHFGVSPIEYLATHSSA